MRRPRFKAPPEHPLAYYHCISRVVDRQFVFGPAEKEQFIEFMRLYERFCGVRVVTYCVMSNHFHVLVEVPQRPAEMPDDAALLALLTEVYGAGGGAGRSGNGWSISAPRARRRRRRRCGRASSRGCGT